MTLLLLFGGKTVIPGRAVASAVPGVSAAASAGPSAAGIASAGKGTSATASGV